MTYSVHWANKVVTIPKADLTLLQASPEIRELNLNDFWLAIRDLEDDEAAQGFPRVVDNTAPKTVAGLTLGRVVEVVNGYKVEFEDGQYSVNVVGANSNIADVKVQNMVSVNTANSAGVVQITSGSGLSSEQDSALAAIKQKTDLFAFSGDHIHAAVMSVNGQQITGSGTPSDPWRPA